MTIRHATSADLDRCVEMGRRFLTETCYRGRIAENPSQMRETANLLVSAPNGALFVAEHEAALVGMIGVLTYTHPLSGESVASELFWWVEPERRGCGVRLLRRAETWAREQGASALQMIAPSPDVATIYERMGFMPVETLYQRVIA